jgi:hypothetical protein
MDAKAEERGTLPGGAPRRNYWAFLFEGGFFVFGLSFVNGQTVLPALILEEGGSSWLAAFMPSIMVIGLFGVPLFNAGWVDRLSRMKPFALAMGFFQRVVYLIIGLLLVFGDFSSTWIVLLLASTPLLSGLIGGFGFSAWQRLYMGGLPPTRRASNLAYRLLIGGIAGIVAGILIERVLVRYPGPVGYGHLHLWASVFFMASWLMLWVVREAAPADSPGIGSAPVAPVQRRSVWAVMRAYYTEGPEVRSRRYFALTLFLMHGFMLLPAFYAVTLLERLGQPKSFLGILAMWQMGGQAVGSLLAAWIGDRWGGRATFGFGLIALCFAVAPAIFVGSLWQAQLAYAAFSFSSMLVVVGKDTLLMEMSPVKGQSSYLSAMAAITMVALLFYGAASQLLWTHAGGFNALAVTCTLICGLAFLSLSMVQDPRGVHVSPLRAIRRGFLRAFR